MEPELMSGSVETANQGLPKILLTTTQLGGGGAEKHLVRIANALTQQFNVHIAVLRRGGSYEEFLNDKVSLHEVGPKWTKRSILGSAWFGVARLAKLISQINPECLISFLEPASWTTHFAQLRTEKKVPHLIGIQNNFSSTLQAFQRPIKSLFISGFEAAIQQADGIIAISSGVGRGITDHFPDLDQGKIKTIYNAGFETLPAAKTPIERSDRRPFQLVACGRLTEQKGFEYLLEAVNLASQKMDIGLWILGVGPLEQDLRDQSRDLGIESRVSFVGFQDDPLQWFSSADLFVLSSKWEGFGNVIVEAMTVSTAVVSTACPYGPDEIIEHGVNGYLVPVGEPDKLATGILDVLSDAATRERLEGEGRKRSLDFSAAKIADQYAEFILTYLSSGGPQN